jgi:hypothetical protein
MYLKALIIKHYELSQRASITQSQRIDEIIALYGKGGKLGKDQNFEILKSVSNLQQDKKERQKERNKSQERDTGDESFEKICLFCTLLKGLPD